MIRLGSDNQDISNTVTYVFYESIFGLLPSLVPLFDPENIQVLQVCLSQPLLCMCISNWTQNDQNIGCNCKINKNNEMKQTRQTRRMGLIVWPPMQGEEPQRCWSRETMGDSTSLACGWRVNGEDLNLEILLFLKQSHETALINIWEFLSWLWAVLEEEMVINYSPHKMREIKRNDILSL